MSLPTLGVAVGLRDLETHLALVRERERDVELQDFIGAETLNGDWRALVDRAKALLGDHAGRVGIHGPFSGFDLASTDPDVAPIVGRRLHQALDVVEALGTRAPHIVVHSPVTVWDLQKYQVMPHRFADAADAFARNVADAVRRAEDIGATFVLENIHDLEPARRRLLVERVASPALKVSIDTGHANVGHGSLGGPPADVYVRDAGMQLAHMHLQDTDGYADRHWTLGTGNIAWSEVFRALAESTGIAAGGLDRPRLIIELRDKAGLPASIAYLSALGVAA